MDQLLTYILYVEFLLMLSLGQGLYKIKWNQKTGNECRYEAHRAAT